MDPKPCSSSSVYSFSRTHHVTKIHTPESLSFLMPGTRNPPLNKTITRWPWTNDSLAYLLPRQLGRSSAAHFPSTAALPALLEYTTRRFCNASVKVSKQNTSTEAPHKPLFKTIRCHNRIWLAHQSFNKITEALSNSRTRQISVIQFPQKLVCRDLSCYTLFEISLKHKVLIQHTIKTSMGFFSKGCWTADEDRMLELFVSTFGTSSWLQVSHSMRTRTPNQCRERYHNFKKPNLNHDPITPEEAGIIVSMVGKLGRRWVHISRCLENRSESAVKNWWYGHVRRQSAACRKAARLESRRQKPGTTKQEATKQSLDITKAQSRNSRHPEDLQHTGNWLSNHAPVEPGGPRTPDIRELRQLSESTTVSDPPNTILPPVSGLRVQPNLDQFKSELKATLWRTQRQSARASPVQQASTMRYTSPVQYTSPSYDNHAAPLLGLPLILVRPASPVRASISGMEVCSKLLKKESLYQSIGDDFSARYDQKIRDYHHATTIEHVLPQRYLRSHDESYAGLMGMRR